MDLGGRANLPGASGLIRLPETEGREAGGLVQGFCVEVWTIRC